jgi:hypothetical protein
VFLIKWNVGSNRLPSKDNLINHEMGHLNSLLCVGGCEVVEASNNLFLECDFSQVISCNIILRLGVYELLKSPTSNMRLP